MFILNRLNTSDSKPAETSVSYTKSDNTVIQLEPYYESAGIQSVEKTSGYLERVSERVEGNRFLIAQQNIQLGRHCLHTTTYRRYCRQQQDLSDIISTSAARRSLGHLRPNTKSPRWTTVPATLPIKMIIKPFLLLGL